MGIVVDVVDDLPLTQATIAGQGHTTGADAAQRQGYGTQRFAAICQGFADGVFLYWSHCESNLPSVPF